MASMSNKARARIIEAAKIAGFLAQLKSDGSDQYDKNLLFKSRLYESLLYIHKETGIHKGSGEFSYLKVAVHPSAFREDLVNPARGIEDYINNQSNQNRHHSSNYRGFPNDVPGKNEPYGKCYKVWTIGALSSLLLGLNAQPEPAS